MPQPLPDLPLPPALALEDEPLTDADLAQLDDALAPLCDGLPQRDTQTVLLALRDAEVEHGAAPVVAAHWQVTDDSAAEWALRHCAQIDSDLHRLSDQREDWQARIDHWFEQATATAMRRRSFFVGHLMAYAAERRAKDPKGPKTLTLPSGRISSTDQKAKVRVTDDDALAVWLRVLRLTEAPDGAELVATTTKVYAVPLRKVLQPVGDKVMIVVTGEILGELPPGLAIEPEHTTYDVKPS